MTGQAMTKEDVLASIQGEISRLIDTRVQKQPSNLAKVNILNYGIIDNVFENLADEIMVSRAESYVRRMIGYFEPRAKDLRVHIVKDDARNLRVDVYFNYDFQGKKIPAEFMIDPNGSMA
jgi:predicted component of type VI protein secretion system